MASLVAPNIMAVEPGFRPGTHTLQASFGLFAQHAGREPMEFEQDQIVDIAKTRPLDLARFCREYGALNAVKMSYEQYMSCEDAWFNSIDGAIAGAETDQ